MPKRWMILGSSPSAPEFYKVPDVDVVASAGVSIMLDIVPDYFFIMEKVALWRYPERIAELRAKGMKVVLSKQAAEMFLGGHRRTYPRDLTLSVPGQFNKGWQDWEIGLITKSTSGNIATQYAVNRGAKEIHLVGLGGYTGDAKKGGNDYWDGQRLSAPKTRQWTMEHFGPFLQRIIDKCPNTQFIVYGDMIFPLKGDNVRAYANDS